MQPHNHLLDTYRKLVDRGAKATTAALDSGRSFVYGEDDRPVPVRTASRTWRPAAVALDDIDKAIVALGEGVVAIQSDSDLTSDAKATRAQILYSEAKVKTDNLATVVNTAAANVTSTLRTAAYPALPTPNDAAQEARIAGVKSDLMLVLGPIDDSMDLLNAMRKQLARAIGDGHEEAAWVLASSRWPEDYLTSRGLADHLESWHAQVASTLNEGAPPKIAEVRRVYNQVTSAQGGLSEVTVSLAQLLPQILTELATWTLTSGRPMPSVRP